MIRDRDDVGIAIRSAFLKKGTQQKFSLVVLIISSIFLVYIDAQDMRYLNPTRSLIKDFIYKGSQIISFPGKLFDNSFVKIKKHVNLVEKNTELEKENILLKESLYNKEFLILENNELKELLNQDDISESNYIRAKVIVDKDSPFLKSVIINKGFKEKIKNGMAVLDGKYFIGRIVETNFFSSRVLLISDLNSKIPVIIEPNGYQAILSGTGNEYPLLDYLPRNHTLAEGNTIYTSGKEGIFSSGIPIGKVILDDDKNILVELFSNFTQLSYVNIDLNITNNGANN